MYVDVHDSKSKKELLEMALDDNLGKEDRMIAYKRYLQMDSMVRCEDEETVKKTIKDILGIEASKIVTLSEYNFYGEKGLDPAIIIIFPEGTWNHDYDIMDNVPYCIMRKFLDEQKYKVTRITDAMISRFNNTFEDEIDES